MQQRPWTPCVHLFEAPAVLPALHCIAGGIFGHWWFVAIAAPALRCCCCCVDDLALPMPAPISCRCSWLKCTDLRALLALICQAIQMLGSGLIGKLHCIQPGRCAVAKQHRFLFFSFPSVHTGAACTRDGTRNAETWCSNCWLMSACRQHSGPKCGAHTGCMLLQCGLKITLHAGEVPNEAEVDAMLNFAPDRFGHMCFATPAQHKRLLVRFGCCRTHLRTVLMTRNEKVVVDAGEQAACACCCAQLCALVRVLAILQCSCCSGAVITPLALVQQH